MYVKDLPHDLKMVIHKYQAEQGKEVTDEIDLEDAFLWDKTYEGYYYWVSVNIGEMLEVHQKYKAEKVSSHHLTSVSGHLRDFKNMYKKVHTEREKVFWKRAIMLFETESEIK